MTTIPGWLVFLIIIGYTLACILYGFATGYGLGRGRRFLEERINARYERDIAAIRGREVQPNAASESEM